MSDVIDDFRGKHGFLSNFHMGEPFWVPELQAEAASGEHAFNALKARQTWEKEWVLDADTPRDAKSRGRRVELKYGWDTGGRVAAMTAVLAAKFQGTTLLRLEETGQALLVEGNTWHDQFWGNCGCVGHFQTEGRNMLGELLMSLRHQAQSRQGR